MDILFLTAHIPVPKGGQAGQVISYFLCRQLARDHQVHLLCLAPLSELKFFRESHMSIFHCWSIVPVTNISRLRGAVTSPRLPLSIAARASRTFREKLQNLLLTGDHVFDVAILDYTPMWQYRSLLGGVPVVGGIAYDVLFQLWGRKAERKNFPFERWLFRKECDRVLGWERTAMAGLDFVSPLSVKDLKLLATLSSVVPQRVIDPVYSVFDKFPPGRDVKQRFSIVFVGAMNRPENVDAVRFAIREILPRVKTRIPDARLWVVGAGSDSPKLSKAMNDPGVIFTGFVEDLAGFLSSMQVALLPLRLGAGIKIKVLECMSAGVAVVTTDVGSEGVQGRHGEHFLVGDNADELAEHVVLLLNSEETRAKMAVKGRAIISRPRWRGFQNLSLKWFGSKKNVPR